MDKDLFNDLIASCKEVIEHKKGNLNLKTTTLEISDDEIEPSFLLFHKIENLSGQKKQRALAFVDELLMV